MVIFEATPDLIEKRIEDLWQGVVFYYEEEYYTIIDCGYILCLNDLSVVDDFNDDEVVRVVDKNIRIILEDK